MKKDVLRLLCLSSAASFGGLLLSNDCYGVDEENFVLGQSASPDTELARLELLPAPGTTLEEFLEGTKQKSFINNCIKQEKCDSLKDFVSKAGVQKSFGGGKTREDNVLETLSNFGRENSGKTIEEIVAQSKGIDDKKNKQCVKEAKQQNEGSTLATNSNELEKQNKILQSIARQLEIDTSLIEFCASEGKKDNKKNNKLSNKIYQYLTGEGENVAGWQNAWRSLLAADKIVEHIKKTGTVTDRGFYCHCSRVCPDAYASG